MYIKYAIIIARQGGIISVYEIEFYRDSKGNEPVKQYLEELAGKSSTNKDARVRLNKIVAYIDLLAEHGTRIGEPVTKHLDGDIWELRPFRDRILYFYWKNDTFVLLHYFVKKTQKTPAREIEQAKRNMADHLERNDIDE